MSHNYIGYNYMSHNYIGHNYMSHNYIGHNYIGHNYIGNNYIGHNYTGHTFFWVVRRRVGIYALSSRGNLATSRHRRRPMAIARADHSKSTASSESLPTVPRRHDHQSRAFCGSRPSASTTAARGRRGSSSGSSSAASTSSGSRCLLPRSSTFT